MSDAEAGWEVERDDGVIYVKMTNDGTICSVIVKYKGDEFYSENGSEINNRVPEIMALMPLDDRLEFHQTFRENCLNFSQYCGSKKEELSHQFQGESMPIAKRIVEILGMLEETMFNSYKSNMPNYNEKQEIDPPKLLPELEELLIPLQVLIKKGQLKFADGECKPYDTPPKFIEWLCDHGYFSVKSEDKEIKSFVPLSVEFIYDNINTGVSLESLKKYYNLAIGARK